MIDANALKGVGFQRRLMRYARDAAAKTPKSVEYGEPLFILE